jgi:hydroxymethylglutaryl-CoA synthase
MSGIRAYGAYIPRTRLPLSLIHGRPAKEGGPEKSIALEDEDSVTMAVAACLDCLGGIDRKEVDQLVFASTSYGQREKQGASVIAKALDLPRTCQTQDVSGSLRAGSVAIETALQTAAAGTAKNILVVASDCRMGAPRGALEAKIGDAAVAFLIGSDAGIATLLGSYNLTNEFQDFWRSDGEPFTHGWEDRFMIQEGYTPAMVEAVRGACADAELSAAELSKAALVAPDARSLGGVLRPSALERGQVQDLLIGQVGHAGTAYGPLLFAAALEKARTGESILAASYGDGAHAMVFRIEDGIEKLPPRLGVSGHLDRRRSLRSYDSYLKARGLAVGEWESGMDLGLAATIRYRERDADIGFIGARCRKCSQIHFPRQRVCYRCHTKDSFDPIRLSDKEGKVVSYTFDYFFPKAEPPTSVVITEVDGCRIQVQLADCEPEDVRLDLPVRYSFRKIHSAGGKPNYFWKAVPATRGEG